MSSMSAKRPRVQYTQGDRKRICQIKQSHPDWNQQKIAEIATADIGKDVNRSSIVSILKQTDKWLAVHESDPKSGTSIRSRGAKWEEMEDVFFEWYSLVHFP